MQTLSRCRWRAASRWVAATLGWAGAFGALATPLASGGPLLWDQPVVSVAVEDEAAWSGTDVAAAVAQWEGGPVRMVLTGQRRGDIVLGTATITDPMVGGQATKAWSGSRITGCRVDLPPRSAGKDRTAVLVHELGHCLGLGHAVTHHRSAMLWTEIDPHWSATVTPFDRDTLANLYR